MHEEEKYYTIEYLVGPDSTKDGDWAELSDFFTDYRFDEAENALAKAAQIARQGKWGQPIKLRVMKYINTVNSWKLREFEPEDYYVATATEMEVQSTMTTVEVEGQTYRIYEYRNPNFIDIVIRDAKGNQIDHHHPKFQAIGIAYTDSTP